MWGVLHSFANKGHIMELSSYNKRSCEVLVIGGGGAGLCAAIRAREAGADVLLVSKFRAGYGNNTILSKATFSVTNVWPDPRDTPGAMVDDTLKGGRYINDPELVATVADGAGDLVEFLERRGVRLIRQKGQLAAISAPGHAIARHARVKHASGRGIIVPLLTHAHEIGVRFAHQIFVTRILKTKEGHIAGAVGFNPDGKLFAFMANSVVLASGGFGQVYQNTNNALGITGDGQGLAYDLGLPLKDMEFVQVYPTAAGKKWTRIVLYEALICGEKGVLRNADGDDILAKHGLATTLTRDRLAQVIMAELLAGNGVAGGVTLDLSAVSAERLAPYGSLLGDSTKKELVVSPTAHFCNGGVVINARAETEVEGLFSAGEVCGGVHGANRLAGNALTEAFVMGGLAGCAAARGAKGLGGPQIPEKELKAEKHRLDSLLTDTTSQPLKGRFELKSVMWHKAGIVRNKSGLESVIGEIETIKHRIETHRVGSYIDLRALLELRNMTVTAKMVCRAALMRSESRGCHHRSDFPHEIDGNRRINIIIHRQGPQMMLQKTTAAGTGPKTA